MFVLPGGPGDGDAVGSVNVEGQYVDNHACLLGWNCGPAAVWSRVEVSVERAAVELHQIQDGSRQPLNYFLWKVNRSRSRGQRLFHVNTLMKMQLAQDVDSQHTLMHTHTEFDFLFKKLSSVNQQV